MKKTINIFISILIITFLYDCSGMVGDFKLMGKLQDTLSKKYGEININITNNQYLTVSLINSKYNSSDSKEKQEIAYEIGKIIMSKLSNDSQIKFGRVSFVENNNYVIVNSSKSVVFDMRLDSLSKNHIDTLKVNNGINK
jgi:hypothetical protein